MAVWLINRPISGYSVQQVEADTIVVDADSINFWAAGEIVCTVINIPGLVVMKRDSRVS